MKLKQVIRNLTCGDQQILLMVIWLVLTRVETEEISYKKLGSCFSWTWFRGVWGVWEAVEIGYTFFGILIGRFKCRKIGWPSKEEILYKSFRWSRILFKEKHQCLLKLHVPLGGERSPVLPNIAGNALKQILIQKLQNLIKINLWKQKDVFFFLKLNQYI